MEPNPREHATRLASSITFVSLMVKAVCICCVISVGLIDFASAKESKKSHSANYDLVLKVGDGRIHVNSSGKVRLDRAIPIEAGGHKVEVSIIERTTEAFVAEVAIFEYSEGSWIQLIPERPTFRGHFGAPVNFSWQTKEIELDLALVIGLLRR